ncbi:hypothetical protein Acor_23440 [Acrocarpospora corrugata]|uniref:Uncharacterized protein n=1 Tax=Acrocarpospora corrugata TaxID=35763 RepID=A0A5M3VZL2_9ACTN|nr:hypothetical protein [Acrocarpospora corrugata]GES00281.1 hypothetical protein Acor_23440 [Acrocarpospora corrugata]
MLTLEDRVTTLEVEVRKLHEKQLPREAAQTRAIAEDAQKSAAAAHATPNEVHAQLNAFRKDIMIEFGKVHAVLATHTRKLDKVDSRLSAHDQRFDRIEHTLKEHDQRFDRIEHTLKEHGEQFDSLTGRLKRVEDGQVEANKMLQTILQVLQAK